MRKFKKGDEKEWKLKANDTIWILSINMSGKCSVKKWTYSKGWEKCPFIFKSRSLARAALKEVNKVLKNARHY